MLFNSIDFAIFLPVVFTIYWLLNTYHLRLQNGLILLASYCFYAWWDWRFLSLILISTLVDYWVGLKLDSEVQASKRRLLLWLSIVTNLGFLGFFKYFNFFQEQFIAAFSFFGQEIQGNSLHIILPVGISFYTFQTLSYTIDIYRNQLKPSKDILAFAAFVAFFPQLVAGPIERAKNLLPQFERRRFFVYSKAVDGLRQILWGLFKKIVIADNCAEYANLIFNNSADHSGATLFLGAVFFAFQIYGDFSGYSDIAIGTARLFGFDLMKNFAFPYFSRDIAEFWRRWHISLSTWFRDYLYIPLGGSRVGKLRQVRNVFIIFVVSGFWHGANWTFVIWGSLHALYFLPLMLTSNNRKNLDTVASNRFLPSAKELLQMAITFGLTTLAWIFFRADNLIHALTYLNGLFQDIASYFQIESYWEFKKILVIIGLFVVVEWLGREGEYAIESMNFSRPLRWLVYLMIGILIFTIGSFNKTEFIYFAF